MSGATFHFARTDKRQEGKAMFDLVIFTFDAGLRRAL
jgi:hypothetical protein